MALTIPSAFRRLTRLVAKDERAVFDVAFYRKTYPDIARASADPFAHFMTHGWREGRDPSAAFNTLFYRDLNMGRDLPSGGVIDNPLTHYVAVGRVHDFETQPGSTGAFIEVQREVVAGLFDAVFYVGQLGRVVEDPIGHYLEEGWRSGLSPRPDFAPSRHREEFAFLRNMAISPFYHYASQARMESRHRSGKAARGRPAARINKTVVDATIAPSFDAAFYLRSYPDVAQAKLQPLKHYIEHGWEEGRDPHPLFRSRFYLADNPEVARAGINPFYHFLAQGKAEGRRGNPVGTRLYPPLAAPALEAWDQVVAAADIARAEVIVIMPVYKGLDETLASIHSVLAAPQSTRFALHVVNDVTPDAALAASLAELAGRGLFSYAVNEANLGFVKSVNGALRLFPDRDVVLLNADVQVFGDWLDRMLAHARIDPTIATITPLSNNATICSYPKTNDNNLIEPEMPAVDLDALAARCNRGRVSDVPTGVGFCFFMSRASRDAVGILDELAFRRGYGEENDFCLRALKAGFRNVLAEDVFVYHAGQVSFAEFAAAEYEPAQQALHRKHPDYPQRIQRFLMADTGTMGRMRLDLARMARDAGPRTMVFVTHALTGGVGTHVADLTARLRDEGVTIIEIRVGVASRWGVEIVSRSASAPYCPNMVPIAFNQVAPLLEEFFDWLAPLAIHVHSLVGFDWVATEAFMALVRRAACPYYFSLHDYSVVCHRNNLVPEGGAFCGLPDVSVCRVCVAADRSYPEAIDPSVRRATFAAFLDGAAAIFAPSRDIADRLTAAGARYPILLRPHEEAGASEEIPPEAPAPKSDRVTFVALGAIGGHKGSHVLLDMARDARARNLPIRFHVVGYTNLKDELAALGVEQTGEYFDEAEMIAEVRAIDPMGMLLLSIWPETFCYTLSTAFALHIPPVVFDLGAQRDRVEEAGFGLVLPPALIDDVASLNDTLLAMRRQERGTPRVAPVRYDNILGDYYGLRGRPAAHPLP